MSLQTSVVSWYGSSCIAASIGFELLNAACDTSQRLVGVKPLGPCDRLP